jgi:hypothetical protein
MNENVARQEMTSLIVMVLGFAVIKIAFNMGRLTGQIEQMLDQAEDAKSQAQA